MGETTLRLPVRITGKACYVDANGTVILKTDFLRGGWFYDNRAPVWDGQHYGFIESCGRVVTSVVYDDVGRFSEGYCAASIGGKWGVIDSAGRWVVEPQFAEVGRCSHGRIGVSKRSGYDLSYIDLEGDVVIESVGLKGMSAFSEGLIAAGDDSSGLYGFRDTTGAWAIAPKYLTAEEFSEGLAAVRLLVKKRELTGYIDTAGNEVLPFKYITAISPFQCGLASVCEKVKRSELFGAINRSGEWVIEPKLEYLGSFFEGLSMFRHEPNSKIGFIDIRGEVVIKESFLAVRTQFSHGISTVKDEQGWWYINKVGEHIWKVE